MVKHFINDRADCSYKNAIALLQKQYGNPHTMLSSYRKEITTWRCCSISEMDQFPDQMSDSES